MRKKFFTLLAGAMAFVAVNAQMTIHPVSPAPTIDGDASDWSATWINMTQVVGTGTGMTAKFQCEYDLKNVYYIFQVTDDTPGDTSYTAGSWERDCVEVMCSLDTTSSAGITGMYQFRRVYGWDAATAAPGGDSGLTDGTIYGSGVSIANWNADPNCKVKEIIDANTYTQEWQLPWDSLCTRMDPAWDHKQFKLEVQASDNNTNASGGRHQQLFWFGNSNNAWNNSAYQGVVTLEVPVNVRNSQVSDFSARYDGSYLRLNKTANVNVYNVTGALLLQATNVNQVSVRNLQSGVYIAKFNNGASYKFVVR